MSEDDKKEDQIELDLEDAQEVEVSTGGDDDDGEQQPLAASEEDNFDKAENATQKRIDRLTKKMREAERQREEAIKYAQGVQSEAQKLQQRMDALDNSYVNEYSTRVETQMGTAEQELARAIEIGDTNGVIEAERKRLEEAAHFEDVMKQVVMTGAVVLMTFGLFVFLFKVML